MKTSVSYPKLKKKKPVKNHKSKTAKNLQVSADTREPKDQSKNTEPQTQEKQKGKLNVFYCFWGEQKEFKNTQKTSAAAEKPQKPKEVFSSVLLLSSLRNIPNWEIIKKGEKMFDHSKMGNKKLNNLNYDVEKTKNS